MASTSARIASTGRSARPVTTQVIAPTRKSKNGSPMRSRRIRLCVLCSTGSRLPATYTVYAPVGVDTRLATTRSGVSPPGRRSMVPTRYPSTPGSRELMRTSLPMLFDAATMAPFLSTTCTRFSSPRGTASERVSSPSATVAATSCARSRAVVSMSVVSAPRWARTSQAPPAVSARATTTTAPMVTRTRTVARRRMSPARGIEPVSRATDGLDQLAPERLVELAPQMADVHLHDVRVAFEREVPDVVEDLGLRHHFAAVA